MSPIAQNRYKEIKDWLKILSPLCAAFFAVFKIGIIYQDFKTHAAKWDAYETAINTHEETDNRIHSAIWKWQADFTKDVNDKIFLLAQKNDK